jgi:hypothetical protein
MIIIFGDTPKNILKKISKISGWNSSLKSSLNINSQQIK